MSGLPEIDQEFMLNFLVELLNTPSPTGFTHHAITLVSKTLKQSDQLELEATRKGALVARWPGESSHTPRGLTAHVDTLGAMVKEIKGNGRLKLTNIGGFAWNTVEGEGLTVFTNDEKQIRGSLLLEKSSSHVHGSDVSKTERILWLSTHGWKSAMVSSAPDTWMIKPAWPISWRRSRLCTMPD